MFKKIFTYPLSIIYGFVVDFRNWLFDIKVLKSVEFDIPIVCIGNITVGGTGKTPHTEFIARFLSKTFHISILSRGYKRNTSGFILVQPSHTSRQVGDEPKQMRLKFPEIPIAVCEKRVEGISKLRIKEKKIDLVIMDDGMQHRYVETWVNILLMDYKRPIYDDYLLPTGSLRDRRSRINQAQIIIVTKCPENIKPIDMRLVAKSLKLAGYQRLFFTRMRSLDAIPIYDKSLFSVRPLQYGDNVVVMAAIGNPAHFIESVKLKYNVIDKLIFSDHYSYTVKDLKAMEAALKKGGENTYIITTEKDSVKLSGSKKIPSHIQSRLYYIPITVEFVDNFRDNTESIFFDALLPYVRKNHKYSMLTY